MAKSVVGSITRAGMLNDYLDAYVLKIERDEAIEIIRSCQRTLAGYLPPNGGEKELIGELLEILHGPEATAMTRRSGEFISHVS
jgi:hypothetical protein